jgi:hypothetical protein
LEHPAGTGGKQRGLLGSRKLDPKSVNRPSKRKKSRKANFTDPVFIRTLEEKALSYYVGAARHKSASTKERLPKQITEDPVFKAIRYLRRFHRAEQRAQELPSELLNEHREQILGSYDSEPAKMLGETFIDAVRWGDIARLKEVVELCELLETTIYRQPRERQSDPHPWHYYTAIVTCQSLKKGVVPTKKQVKEAALRERAIVELPTWDPAWDSKWSNLQKQRWQSKHHAVTKRELNALTKRKPSSVKDLREKRIAAKVEQLRPLQPKNWARIFRDLGLGALPSERTHPKKQAAKTPSTVEQPIAARKVVNESPDELIDRLANQYPELDVYRIAADHKAQLEASGQLFQGRHLIDRVIRAYQTHIDSTVT